MQRPTPTTELSRSVAHAYDALVALRSQIFEAHTHCARPVRDFFLRVMGRPHTCECIARADRLTEALRETSWAITNLEKYGSYKLATASKQQMARAIRYGTKAEEALEDADWILNVHFLNLDAMRASTALLEVRRNLIAEMEAAATTNT